MDDFSCPALAARSPLSSDDVDGKSIEEILAEADATEADLELDFN